MKPATVLPALLLSLLVACGDDEPVQDSVEGADALAIGDSVLDWNRGNGSIPEVLARQTGLVTANRAVSGSRVLGGEYAIPGQYVSQPYQHVLIDGGANDVGECGCANCMPVVDQIVAEDLGSGAMVSLVDRIVADGGEAILMGYYLVPPGTEFDGCDDEILELNDRYRRLAAQAANVVYVNAGDVMDYREDRSHYDEDDIHPSAAGSEVIGRHIAEQIAP